MKDYIIYLDGFIRVKANSLEEAEETWGNMDNKDIGEKIEFTNVNVEEDLIIK